LDPIKRQLRLLDQQLEEKTSLHKIIFTRSPLFIPACGFLAGIVIRHFLNFHIACPLAILVLTAIASVIVAASVKHSARVYIAAYSACIAFAALGAIRLASFHQPSANDIRNFVGNQRILATIRGTLITKVHLEDRDTWKFGRYLPIEPSSSFYLKLDSVKTKNEWTEVTGTVRVQVTARVKGLNPGDYVNIYCWLQRFNPPLNPGQFNFEKYLRRRVVFVGVSVKSQAGIELLQRASLTSFARFKYKFKTIAAHALLDEATPNNQSSALLAALLLGKRASLDTNINGAFRKTGLLHFISLSGLHLGILAGMLWWLAKTAGLSKRTRAAVCLIIIALYVIIVPPRAPILRAAILCAFFCISVIVRRQPNPLNTLSLAAITLLLIRPMDLFNAGWQLSYTTVFGIIVFYNPVANFLLTNTIDKIPALQPREDQPPTITFVAALANRAVELFAVGIAAWLGGAGVMLYHFGTITPTAALWTVLIFPLVFAILAAGFLKIVLAAVLPTLALIIGLIAAALSNLMIIIVKFFAACNISGLLIGKVSIAIIICYYCLVLFARFTHFRKPLVKKLICTTLAVVIFAYLGLTKYNNSALNHLELTTLAVGHGQAVFVRLPGNETMLFDAGSLTTKDCGNRIIVPFLNAGGINSIDAIILSHDDIDHINAVPEIIAACKVKAVYANSAFLEKADTFSMAGVLKTSLVDNNHSLSLIASPLPTTSAKLTSLWPTPAIAADPTISDNDKSQVTLIEFAGRKILLCSDIERLAQQHVLTALAGQKIDVVIMPHHGSTTNLLDGFIEDLNPQIAIASCSFRRAKSAFKPKPPTRAFYTPIDGAVTIKIKANGQISAAAFLLDKTRPY